NLLSPLFLGTDGEGPSLTTTVRLAEIDARDFVGDGIGFRVGLTVSASLGSSLRPQVGADRTFTELAAEQFEVVGLISAGYRVEVVIKRGRLQHVGRLVFGVRIIFG